ncbi:MAG TPA: hypothetical protein VNT79_16960 [Phycisphaerae bacterium]|nr:hypothetical protein [Phycisphaerae bacterium]
MKIEIPPPDSLTLIYGYFKISLYLTHENPIYILRSEGATGCSHGWSEAEPVDKVFGYLSAPKERRRLDVERLCSDLIRLTLLAKRFGSDGTSSIAMEQH